jgi:hypothetical protein
VTSSGKGKVHIGFSQENLRARGHFKILGIGKMMILKMIFKK